MLQENNCTCDKMNQNDSIIIIIVITSWKMCTSLHISTSVINLSQNMWPFTCYELCIRGKFTL